MAYILNIETATSVCSVSICDEEIIIYEKEKTEGPSHASLLGKFVDDAMKFAKQQNISLDAVAVSCGPGSYTGLRIGVSEAKGLCFGLDIPLIAINTPLIMAQKVIEDIQNLETTTLLCPMIDARRMEVYAAIYDANLITQRAIQADIVDENSYLDFLKTNKVAFFGNGSEKCRSNITHPNAIFIEGIYPQAKSMSQLAQSAYQNKQFVDVAYFEPFYLKEFVATTPKNKVLSE